jgi:hypothetical protein
MRRSVDHSAVPPGRTVVRFGFPDQPARTRSWWLVITTGTADVCDFDPGYEVTVTITAALRHLVEIWRGDQRWPDALRTGSVTVHGPEDLRHTVPGWFTLPAVAAVPRSPTNQL